MTDKTPATVAGRRLDAKGPVLTFEERHADILAIEAEARAAEHERVIEAEAALALANEELAGAEQWCAEERYTSATLALREAAERVRALEERNDEESVAEGYSMVRRSDVLAILTEQER